MPRDHLPRLAIFALTYLVIASQKIPCLHLDRPSGVLMVICGVLTLDEAYQAINYDTITLLPGMMILVGNPQNMLVGIYSGWSYGGFFLRMLPIGLLGLLLNFILIYFVFKNLLLF